MLDTTRMNEPMNWLALAHGMVIWKPFANGSNPWPRRRVIHSLLVKWLYYASKSKNSRCFLIVSLLIVLVLALTNAYLSTIWRSAFKRTISYLQRSKVIGLRDS